MITPFRRVGIAAWLTIVAATTAIIIPAANRDQLRAQDADGPFVEELKSQNAHLFDKPLKLAKEQKPATLKRDYEEKLGRTEWQLSDGPVGVDVTLKKGGPPDGVLYMNPVVSVSIDGRQVIRSEGSESFPDNPVFLVQIAEMDPSNPHPEVVFSTYTGGAHCCSDTRVLTSTKDGKQWREISVGPFDGGPLAVSDLDGDGRYELATRDNAFLYTFGCYACSTAPLLVLALQDGKLKNVSGEPAFRAHQLESLKRIIEWADEGADRNGFLAGYVGQKILLGEGKPAWQLMLKYYDRKSDWGLEACAVKRAKDGECPRGKAVKLTYPEALERFLTDNDYKLTK